MKIRKNQLGVAAVEGLLILVILVLIGLVGYKVTQTRNSVDQSNNVIDSQTTGQTVQDSVPAINNAADLNKASQALDKVNPDDSGADSSSLDQNTASL